MHGVVGTIIAKAAGRPRSPFWFMMLRALMTGQEKVQGGGCFDRIQRLLGLHGGNGQAHFAIIPLDGFCYMLHTTQYCY